MNSHQRGTFIRNDPEEVARIAALLSDLQWSLEIIGAEIEIEEERARWPSPEDPHYPLMGRALRTRRDNLAATIRAIEKRTREMTPTA
jgi:hypothetical protein